MSYQKPLYKTDIEISSGNGGNGCVSFRREKRIAKGGPDGGNGGNGGSIFICGDPGMLSLMHFKYKKHWSAENGKDGSSCNKKGASGEDKCIKVPYGTEVWCGDEILCDIVSNEMREIAKGGRGGLGNAVFAAPDLTTPYIATKGKKGTTLSLTLVLKHMADVGVIGLPNAGKSSFVHEISGANVKIGHYEFTTIEPSLGVVKYCDSHIVFADLPGLVEGAHMNIGLGHEFLQHLTRCKILLHMLDASSENPLGDFNIIRNELHMYDPELLNKEHILCISKIDLISESKISQLKTDFKDYNVQFISQIIPQTINQLIEHIHQRISLHKN